MLEIAALRSRCAGPVVGPEDPGYAQACRECGVDPRRRPAAVGFPADADDVECMTAAARDAGLAVADAPAAAASGDLTGSLLLGPAATAGYAAA
jgi:hypothetical protein